jgi:hypothetical protein
MDGASAAPTTVVYPVDLRTLRGVTAEVSWAWEGVGRGGVLGGVGACAAWPRGGEGNH